MKNRNLAIFTALFLTYALSACSSEQPSSDMDKKPGASKQPPKIDSTDNAFIGLNEEQAQSLAKARKLRFRVIMRDGKHLPATKDMRQDRVNATIVDGKITATRRG